MTRILYINKVPQVWLKYRRLELTELFPMASFPKLLRKATARSRLGNLSMTTMSGAVVPPLPSPSPSPWLMCPPSFKGRDMTYHFYSPSDGKVINLTAANEELRKLNLNLEDKTTKVVGSTHGWLVLFNERNLDLFLINPLSHQHIKLPPIHTLPIPEENLTGGYGCVEKVIISTSPNDHQACQAMMTYGPASYLAFCGLGSNGWTPIGDKRVYHDFVYSSRHTTFFCITDFFRSSLEAWDLRDPASPERVLKVPTLRGFREDYPDYPLKHYCGKQNYLAVTDDGEILVVRRHVLSNAKLCSDGSLVEFSKGNKGYNEYKRNPHKTVGFDVYKFDRKENKVKYMEGSLDGVSLFVGVNHSTVLEGPQLKTNSIYFTDDDYSPEDYVYGGHDIGIFNYEDGTFSSCHYPCDVNAFKRIDPPPVWFFPTSE